MSCDVIIKTTTTQQTLHARHEDVKIKTKIERRWEEAVRV
jgi:hypothetical protein